MSARKAKRSLAKTRGSAPVRDPGADAPREASCRLAIKVTPGAPRDEVVGELGDAIRVKLRAPPVEGRANAALLAFLADQLDLHTSALRLVVGETARHKIVAISGLAIDEVRRRLLSAT